MMSQSVKASFQKYFSHVFNFYSVPWSYLLQSFRAWSTMICHFKNTLLYKRKILSRLQANTQKLRMFSTMNNLHYMSFFCQISLIKLSSMLLAKSISDYSLLFPELFSESSFSISMVMPFT